MDPCPECDIINVNGGVQMQADYQSTPFLPFYSLPFPSPLIFLFIYLFLLPLHLYERVYKSGDFTLLLTQLFFPGRTRSRGQLIGDFFNV